MSEIKKILFLGTPALAVPFLQKCAENFEVVGVVTAPDKPAGRGNRLASPPIKTAAEELKLKVFQPDKASNKEFLEEIQKLDFDIAVVVAYGEILSEEFLNLAPFGSINVHFSLLPRWRGASPVQHTILTGDQKTGVAIQQMVYKLDAGNILSSQEIEIKPTDTTQTLFEKLSKIGADLLIETLNSDFSPIPQDESKATFCGKIQKSDGELDFQNKTAVELDRQLRAYTPWPGVYTTWQGERLKILEAVPNETSLSPGEVSKIEDKLLIGTASGSLEIKKLQKAGKPPVSSEQFLNGYSQIINTTLPN